MANEENLKKFGTEERSVNEAREFGRKGGIASGKARRQKRTLQEAAQLVLDLPVTGKRGGILAQYGIPDEERTNLMLIVVGVFQKAFEGDIKAVSFIRKLIEEKPQKQGNIELEELIDSSYEESLKRCIESLNDF